MFIITNHTHTCRGTKFVSRIEILDSAGKRRRSPKGKFFTWTVLPGKILTAENLAILAGLTARHVICVCKWPRRCSICASYIYKNIVYLRTPEEDMWVHDIVISDSPTLGKLCSMSRRKHLDASYLEEKHILLFLKHPKERVPKIGTFEIL